jgi:hypothetical protein
MTEPEDGWVPAAGYWWRREGAVILLRLKPPPPIGVDEFLVPSPPESVEPPKRLCEWWRWDGCKTDTNMCQWPNCPPTPDNVECPT